MVAAGAQNISFLAGNTSILPEIANNPSAQAIRNSYSTTFNTQMQSVLAGYAANGVMVHYLDLTLVGHRILEYYKLTGFFVPGVHSRPVTEGDLHIAPDLLPLREQLMAMVKRPVNIQGTRDWVMYFRGELLGQPYLTLVEKAD